MSKAELLPPEPGKAVTRGPHWWESPKWQKARPYIFTLSFAGCFGFVLWGLNQFLALRGVVNVGASRVILVLTVAAAILMVLIATRLVPRNKNTWFAVGSAMVILLAILLDSWAPKPKELSPAKEVIPPLEQIAVYMECQWSHYPVTIPPTSTVHVLRLHPDFLKGNPSFRAEGIFHDFTAGDKALTWPSVSDGKWPSKAEAFEAMKKGIMQSPFLFKCDLKSFGKTTIEEVSIPMWVRPMEKDAKGRVYQIPFDPLTTGMDFPFYVVNYCSSQIYVTWPDTLRVHVLGEPDNRVVPLKMIKRDWPGDLMIFMPSAFKWSGIQNCDWGW